MEETAYPVENRRSRRGTVDIRPDEREFTGADLERARFIAELIARGATTAAETVATVEHAMLRGLAATAGGDLAGGTHLLGRGLIASALAAWQFNELGTDAMEKCDPDATRACRSAAEIQLAMLPGRAGLAAGALRALAGGEAAVQQVKATLLAFVEGSGVVTSLFAVTLREPWLRSLVAAFDPIEVGAAYVPVRTLGVPRLVDAQRRPESRRAVVAGEGRPALSAREADVLTQIVAGLTTAEIARELGIKSTTVSTLVGRIFNKLGVNNRPAAVAVALRYGLCVGIDDRHA